MDVDLSLIPDNCCFISIINNTPGTATGSCTWIRELCIVYRYLHYLRHYRAARLEAGYHPLDRWLAE